MVKNIALLILVLSSSHVYCTVDNGKPDLPAYSKSYDPGRDPFNDLVLATNEAEATNRLVLLIVGGDWCSWCLVLEKYLEKNEEFSIAFYQTFEVVKIFYGTENENEFFLSKFPRIKAYPHFFIMDANFGLLGSQNSSSLEKRKKFPLSPERYREEYMNEFLNKWADYLFENNLYEFEENYD